MEDRGIVETIWGAVWPWLQNRGPDILVGVVAIAAVWFVIELIKPWLKLGFAKWGLSEGIEDATLKTMPYVVGSLIAVVLDFSAHWASLTGIELNGWRSILLGTILTGGAAHVSYYLTRKLEVLKTLKLRWQRFNGVTQDDLDTLRTTRAKTAVTEEDIARWRKEQESDET